MTAPENAIATARSIISKSQYQTVITSGKHAIIADEPENHEGSDTGMTPKELLLASLSSCTAITLQMYIKRKMWIVDEVTIDQELYTIGKGTFIKSYVSVKGEVSDEQIQRLHQIADVCPVHKMLTGEIIIETVMR
ncbi:OsmC family protein [Mucilaginibacter myungsuensis]|uniref:OsmC family protein n=1 Tax=Mucilaginibacter myungsuensis TaxID=649104 RepID=A0A929KUR2_9SPHI|nr:OsmC family protein [Mucilaginibacter myungsuensis]MBE9660263.1 OsmC family protein [Mucilaginibacter myungsuensis]MDN3600305.1 OsmC family protein [Mucilaginibacter myungsuensis]